jgi:hypothetical protein
MIITLGLDFHCTEEQDKPFADSERVHRYQNHTEVSPKKGRKM